MTLEQYVMQFLENELSMQLKTVVSVGNTSLRLQDSNTINKWQQQTSFEVIFLFPSKIDAAQASVAFKQAASKLRDQNWIHTVDVDAERAEREGAPASWSYLVNLTLLHRRRDSWQL